MSIAAIAKKKRAKKRSSAVAAGTRKHRLHVPPAAGTTSTEVTLTSMSPAMVERLFWRAGFGPSAEDRATWAGKPVADASTRSSPGRPTSSAPPPRGTARRSIPRATTPTWCSPGSTEWCARATRSRNG